MNEPVSSSPILVRPAARALVFDPQDRLLLIEYANMRRLPPVNSALRSFWFLPGGGLESGETYEQACRRELSEEIGVENAPIGPLVAICEGPFHLFEASRDARERYFLVRLPDDRIDTRRLAETEDNPVLGTRWWTLEELQASKERIEPSGLAALARLILHGDVPDPPMKLDWH